MSRVEQLAEGVTLHCGDCLDVLATLDANSVDAVVTDPPYGLEFMGKGWDGADGFRRSLNGADAGRDSVFGRTSRRAPEYKAGNLFQQFSHAWSREAFRVLKPGAHLLAFGGTRTSHRMACAIEDAGFEIRDTIMWVYGSGFPKSLDVSKAIDRAAGAEREVVGKRQFANGSFARDGAVMGQHGVYGAAAGHPLVTAPSTDAAREWEGFGTALKPACEPIVLARKPLSESTVAANVLKWGPGALNIDGCRVEPVEGVRPGRTQVRNGTAESIMGQCAGKSGMAAGDTTLGRWPANVIHDGSDEVVGAFPGDCPGAGNYHSDKVGTGNGVTYMPTKPHGTLYADQGSAARFFYTAKADADDRLGSKHPTVKPLDLMQYLVRLVTPPKGLVLDPFAGTGTTGEACIREGMRAILIERETEYQDDIRRRMALAMAGTYTRQVEAMKAKLKGKPIDMGPLFK